MQLTGIHHLTAITADAPGNNRFYTEALGLRRVKKTVNQDDTSAYHLFFADGAGSPGTDITFFDWPAAREQRGTNSIIRTGLRVREESLDFWAARLRDHGATVGEIGALDARAGLDVEDPEGQRLRLVAGPDPEGQPWERTDVPAEHQIHGLGPITISVPDLGPTEAVLTQVMNMRRVRDYRQPRRARPGPCLRDGRGRPGGRASRRRPAGPAAGAARSRRRSPRRLPRARHGRADAWTERVKGFRVPSSGEVERYYFRSLYFREPGGVLFELATDGPGFDVDEPAETMGEGLSLPPFLEGKRAKIEAGLKPLK